MDRFCACILAGFCCALAEGAEPAVGDRPNIVLCMSDDQGWGDVSYNGMKQIQTPHLDQMAASGVRFERFYAAAPVCSPTRASVLTGRHPYRSACLSWGFSLRQQQGTLAQLAKQAGYRTAHFGKWHLNGIDGAGKPIAADDPFHPGRFGFDHWVSASNFFDTHPRLGRNGTAEQFAGDGSDVVMAEAVKFIDAAVQDHQPFLAVVWFGSPHLPHEPLTEDRKQAQDSPYHGEILGIDRGMGALRKRLQTLGVADNTLVWFCSDNGPRSKPSFNSTAGLRGLKDTLWEGGIRVPGLLVWPARVRKPLRSEVPASTCDILPTLLDVWKLKQPALVEPLDGISILPLLDGKMTQRSRPLGFWHLADAKKFKNQNQDQFAKDLGHAAWLDNRYKLLKFGPEKYELYDVTNDAAESTDLAGRLPDVMKKMHRELDVWQESVLKSFRGKDGR